MVGDFSCRVIIGKDAVQIAMYDNHHSFMADIPSWITVDKGASPYYAAIVGPGILVSITLMDEQ
jgi:hypothetical protein